MLPSVFAVEDHAHQRPLILWRFCRDAFQFTDEIGCRVAAVPILVLESDPVR